MGMRYIEVPRKVTLKNADGSTALEVGLSDFVREALLVDRRWMQSLAWLESARCVTEAIDGKEPGEIVTLAGEDWERLCEVAKAPTIQLPNGQTIAGFGNFTTTGAIQLLPLIHAITKAADKASLKEVESA